MTQDDEHGGQREGPPASAAAPALPADRRPPASTPPREGSARGRGRGPDGGRRRGERRAHSGFGDELERAFCEAYRHLPPPDFPVQHRTGIATLRTTVVARREGALLLCDGGHPGAHRWPDGEPVPGPADAAGHQERA